MSFLTHSSILSRTQMSKYTHKSTIIRPISYGAPSDIPVTVTNGRDNQGTKLGLSHGSSAECGKNTTRNAMIASIISRNLFNFALNFRNSAHRPPRFRGFLQTLHLHGLFHMIALPNPILCLFFVLMIQRRAFFEDSFGAYSEYSLSYQFAIAVISIHPHQSSGEHGINRKSMAIDYAFRSCLYIEMGRYIWCSWTCM